MIKLLRIGIQGGPGSFNEEAIYKYMNQQKIGSHKIYYLYTTENVLLSLKKGKIDRGQFAIFNTIGGEVEESKIAIKKYSFTKLAEYKISIAHTLLVHPNTKLHQMNTIMAHPQALAQCKTNLSNKFPSIEQRVGKNSLVDPAKIAEYIHMGKLPATTGVVGSRRLASIYNLKIAARNLQDDYKNYTTFILVK